MINDTSQLKSLGYLQIRCTQTLCFSCIKKQAEADLINYFVCHYSPRPYQWTVSSSYRQLISQTSLLSYRNRNGPENWAVLTPAWTLKRSSSRGSWHQRSQRRTDWSRQSGHSPVPSWPQDGTKPVRVKAEKNIWKWVVHYEWLCFGFKWFWNTVSTVFQYPLLELNDSLQVTTNFSWKRVGKKISLQKSTKSSKLQLKPTNIGLEVECSTNHTTCAVFYHKPSNWLKQSYINKVLVPCDQNFK